MPVAQVGSRFGNLDPHDVIDLLPDPAAMRLHAARLRRDDAQGAMRVVLDQISEQRALKLDYEDQLRRLQWGYHDNRAPQFGGPPRYEEDPADAALTAAERANKKLTTVLPGDVSQAVELKNKIDRAFREMQRLGVAEEQRAAIWNTRGRLVRNVEMFISDGIPSGCSLQALPEPAVKLAKGAHIIDEIESKRRRGRELASDLHTCRSAPITANAARAKVRAFIEKLSERGCPSLDAVMFGAGDVGLPEMNMQAKPVMNDTAMLIAWQEVDAAAYITWLLGEDVVAKKFDALIAAEFTEPGISDEDRASREAVILRDALAVAREECALVELANAQGVNVEAREDIEPTAFLNLAIITERR
jgi:hypothetical protein